MARSRVRLLSPGMSEVLYSDGVRGELTEHAQTVLAAAQASAPVKTGAYRDSLHLVQDSTDRAVVRVVADQHGPLVEAQTGNLARALGSA